MLPVVRLLDDFNRADAPTLGANWRGVGWTGRMYRYEIVSNAAQCRYVASGQDYTAAAWHTTFTPPYEVMARVYLGTGFSFAAWGALFGHTNYLGATWAQTWGIAALRDNTTHNIQMCYANCNGTGASYAESVLHSGYPAGWLTLRLQMTDSDQALGTYILPGESAWRSLVPYAFPSVDMSGHVGMVSYPNYWAQSDIQFDDFRAGAPAGLAAIALGTTAPTVARRIPVAPAAAAFALGTTAPTVARRQFRVWNLKPRSFVWRCHDVEHP